MAGEHVAQLPPTMLNAGGGGLPGGSNKDPFGLIMVGAAAGSSFGPKATTEAYYLMFIPAAATLGTGLTFSLITADDPLNAGAGLVSVYGITVTPASAVALADAAFASSTEVTGTVTSNATAGKTTVTSIAVPIASMNSLAASSWAFVRIRRLGLNSSDTNTAGRSVLLGVQAHNT